MAIIKDLVEIGKQLQKLETGYERLDNVYASNNYNLYDLRGRIVELSTKLAKIETCLSEFKILPKKHWWS